MTVVANPGLGRAEDLFRGLIWDNAVQAGLVALFLEAPWLNVWPLRPIVQTLVGLLSSKVYDSLRLAVDTEAIALVNADAQKAFDRASVSLSLYEQNFGPNSPEYKKAREDAKAALSRFVSYRGA